MSGIEPRRRRRTPAEVTRRGPLPPLPKGPLKGEVGVRSAAGPGPSRSPDSRGLGTPRLAKVASRCAQRPGPGHLASSPVTVPTVAPKGPLKGEVGVRGAGPPGPMGARRLQVQAAECRLGGPSRVASRCAPTRRVSGSALGIIMMLPRHGGSTASRSEHTAPPARGWAPAGARASPWISTQPPLALSLMGRARPPGASCLIPLLPSLRSQNPAGRRES